jgi:hypothetical protein
MCYNHNDLNLNKNYSYKHNEQISKPNIDNSECFSVKFVKIYWRNIWNCWAGYTTSYNLMLNCGGKNCALRDKKNQYSDSCVVRKKISERQSVQTGQQSVVLAGWSHDSLHVTLKQSTFPFWNINRTSQ